MDWHVGITTAPREPSTLNRSLRSINDAGWLDLQLFAEPGTQISFSLARISLYTNESRLGPCGNFSRVASHLLTLDRPTFGYIIFQDDIVVSKNTRQFLERVLWPESVPGICSLYCCQRNHKVQSGWHQHSNPSSCYGALGLVIHGDVMPLVVERFSKATKVAPQIDVKIAQLCLDNNLPYWIHSPSLIRHIGTTSTISDMPITPNRNCKEFCQDAGEL